MMIELRKPDATLIKLLQPAGLRSDIVYVPSQFAIRFEHNGNRYVFNNLTKHLIQGDLPSSARVGEGFDDLIVARFLVPEDKDECACYNGVSALMRAFCNKKGVQGYTILPTLSCNARCVYCYEEGVKPTTMTPETVEQTIRYIVSSHVGDKAKIAWFGGEPLLGEAIIDRICEGMRESGVPYGSEMISNGRLITPEIVEKMTGPWRLKRIQISMDGDEKDYVARKRYRQEGDHYRSVMRAIDLMADKRIIVQVRCNVDEENLDGIPTFLRELSANVRYKDYVSVYLAPLYQTRSGERAMPFWEKALAARPLIESAGFQVGRIKEERGTSFRVSHCMADSGCVVVCPDGTLTPCEHLPQGAAFGDVWHGVTNEAARREFCRVDRVREKCRACPFLPDCTNFASCPVQDVHCRELRELMVVNALKRVVAKEEKENADEDPPVC